MRDLDSKKIRWGVPEKWHPRLTFRKDPPRDRARGWAQGRRGPQGLRNGSRKGSGRQNSELHCGHQETAGREFGCVHVQAYMYVHSCAHSVHTHKNV